MRHSKPTSVTPASFLSEVSGWVFKNPELLTRALTHRSLTYETNPETISDPNADNEQMEFLGDAVLGLIVAESLFRRFTGSREGTLTRLRASLVSSSHLAQVGLGLHIGNALLLGRGEEQSGGRQKPALLANAMEALIAALYLDGGLDAARAFVEKTIVEPSLSRLEQSLKSDDAFGGAIGDYKSALQEHLQATGGTQPEYRLMAERGPDHQKLFRIEVLMGDNEGNVISLSEAEGATKKKAQQEAARLALARLRGAELSTIERDAQEIVP